MEQRGPEAPAGERETDQLRIDSLASEWHVDLPPPRLVADFRSPLGGIGSRAFPDVRRIRLESCSLEIAAPTFSRASLPFRRKPCKARQSVVEISGTQAQGIGRAAPP